MSVSSELTVWSSSPIVTEDDYVPFVDPTKLTMTIPLSESPSSSLPTDPSDDEI